MPYPSEVWPRTLGLLLMPPASLALLLPQEGQTTSNAIQPNWPIFCWSFIPGTCGQEDQLSPPLPSLHLQTRRSTPGVAGWEQVGTDCHHPQLTHRTKALTRRCQPLTPRAGVSFQGKRVPILSFSAMARDSSSGIKALRTKSSKALPEGTDFAW